MKTRISHHINSFFPSAASLTNKAQVLKQHFIHVHKCVYICITLFNVCCTEMPNQIPFHGKLVKPEGQWPSRTRSGHPWVRISCQLFYVEVFSTSDYGNRKQWIEGRNNSVFCSLYWFVERVEPVLI